MNKLADQIKRYIAFTISCYSIAIGVHVCSTLDFNRTIRIGFKISDRSDTGAGIDQYSRIDTIESSQTRYMTNPEPK